ncbi:MAG: hypothetical protein K8S55_05450 [Phycisphaerae bacterium]|nr:hypothetical protein [Phycisphaerae bacterium]
MEKRVFRRYCPEWDELVACAMQLPGQDPAYKNPLLRDTLHVSNFDIRISNLLHTGWHGDTAGVAMKDGAFAA